MAVDFAVKGPLLMDAFRAWVSKVRLPIVWIMKGTAQQMNLGAEIFLAHEQGRYVGGAIAEHLPFASEHDSIRRPDAAQPHDDGSAAISLTSASRSMLSPMAR